MIFGRKSRRARGEADTDDEVDATLDDREADLPDDDPDVDSDVDSDAVEAAGDGVEEHAEDDFDPRADGPFDHEEVDLDSDEAELAALQVRRVAFGPLIVTQPHDLRLQLQGDQKTNAVYTLLAHHENSGLEVALFAAPRSGGLAQELREDIVEEATQAGGSAELAFGPFGTEVRRVLPLNGPEGEQLFHVSRIWLVEGPRWLLRGTLMGQAGLVEGEKPPADFFVEFFRNLVVRRDDAPRSPGEIIQLAVPEGTIARG
ncbi:MAG: DUF3710 domain-containing protein [Propionibacteriaceae bacterium]|nr:DUF3710 domain-containing protein [Propionibacteriaceae bacterium]